MVTGMAMFFSFVRLLTLQNHPGRVKSALRTQKI